MVRLRLYKSVSLPAALAAALLTSFALASFALGAGPKAADRAKAHAAETELNKAAKLYTEKKYDQAAVAVTIAQKHLSELSASKDNAELVAPLYARLVRAHQLFAEQGIELRPLDEELAAAAKPVAAAAANVSFTSQVAPLLVGKCAGCHIRATKGGLSMASFAALSKGSRNGRVIDPGKSKTSRIIELMESGDMPRGGDKVSPDELALVARWIDAGAKFDGKDPLGPLSKSAPAPAGGAKGTLNLVQATGKETVRFARDVGPAIVAQCTGCHSTQNRRGELVLDTFAHLLAGGESGPLLVPGNPGESLIVKKLRGTAGERMPLDKPALSADVIAKFEKWISEGAKFDGADPAQPLAELVAWVHVQTATHEELTKERTQLAAKNWRLTLPDAQTEKGGIETKNFIVFGNVDEETLSTVSRTAEEQAAKLLKQFKAPEDQPFVKGRLTIYVFERRYDYGEIGTMVEKRDIPTDWHGHWRVAPPDAYACLLRPSRGDYSLPALVTQQIAGAYLASQGHVPRWFVEGSARAFAAKLDPKAPQIKRWDNQVADALTQSTKVDDFLTGALPQDETDALGYSFVKFLTKKPGPYQATLAALRAGAPFDQAFAKHFGATPVQLATPWALGSPVKRGR